MSTFKIIAVSNRELYRQSHGAAEVGMSKPEVSKTGMSEVDMEAYVNHLSKLESAKYKPDMLILREKDLAEEEYEKLLKMVWDKLSDSSVEVIPHTFLKAAKNTGIANIHLPFPLLKKYMESQAVCEAIDEASSKAVCETSCEAINEASSGAVCETSCENRKILQGMKVIGTSVHSLEEALEAERLGASYVTAGHIFSTECKPGLEPRGLTFLQKICEGVKIPVYAIGGIHPDNLEKIAQTGAAGACMMSEFMRAEYTG